MAELAKCPFCNHEAKSYIIRDKKACIIQCQNRKCHATMRFEAITGEHAYKKAVAAWNMRNE